MTNTSKKRGYQVLTAFLFIIIMCIPCFAGDIDSKNHTMSSYDTWRSIGKLAADTSLNLLKINDPSSAKGALIVLTNAGYAEINGASTQGALDGLADVTGASRGKNTLLEIHSAAWDKLWFAVYDKSSGHCAYLETDPKKAGKMKDKKTMISPDLFNVKTMERIDAEFLYKHSSEYKEKFDALIFGGNEFRIITIANAVAGGAPTYAVRAFEFHDHYCPGVTSGILIAEYLKKYFPVQKGGYFVHSVEPWCKEDALLVILNATPGKKSYAVSYPNEEDKQKRIAEAKNASTIVYRQNKNMEKWEGIILAFEWAKTPCPDTGSSIIDKLCADLWYLKNMEQPEDFVKVIRDFELQDGVSPADLARPGKDPLTFLGMVE
jgi:formylmethanofuran dehydrogenase subunit E-like metal-binding protein